MDGRATPSIRPLWFAYAEHVLNMHARPRMLNTIRPMASHATVVSRLLVMGGHLEDLLYISTHVKRREHLVTLIKDEVAHCTQLEVTFLAQLQLPQTDSGLKIW